MRALLEGLVVVEPGSLLGQRPLSIALLTNRTRAAERRRVLAGLADGTIDLAIGTHALIQEGIEFRSLGVAVVDEQHRFGWSSVPHCAARVPADRCRTSWS